MFVGSLSFASTAQIPDVSNSSACSVYFFGAEYRHTIEFTCVDASGNKIVQQSFDRSTDYNNFEAETLAVIIGMKNAGFELVSMHGENPPCAIFARK